MRHTPTLRSAVLIGLLVVSLASYWAADTGSTALQAVMLGLLGLICLAAVWLWR
jgi:hypothetical protein